MGFFKWTPVICRTCFKEDSSACLSRYVSILSMGNIKQRLWANWDMILTSFSLPLVKHGDSVLRIRFHLSSFTTVIASSRGPPLKAKSWEQREYDMSNTQAVASSLTGPSRYKKEQHPQQHHLFEHRLPLELCFKSIAVHPDDPCLLAITLWHKPPQTFIPDQELIALLVPVCPCIVCIPD